MTDQNEISQEILDEALDPESSEDFFEFEGRKVQLKPLKIKYQKKWAKTFTPVMDSIALGLADNQQKMVIDELGRTSYQVKGLTDFSLVDWLAVGSALLDQADVLPKLVQIICHNDGYLITDAQLEESSAQPEELQAIVLRHCEKAGSIERQVADFFQTVLPLVKDEISGALQKTKAQLLSSLDKGSSTTTA